MPDKRAHRANEVLLHMSGNATYQDLAAAGRRRFIGGERNSRKLSNFPPVKLGLTVTSESPTIQTKTTGKRFGSTTQSNPHELVQLRRRHAPVEETEVAFVFHFPYSVEETGQCRAIERGRKADPPDSRCGEFLHRK
jgi:hypothetical protein